MLKSPMVAICFKNALNKPEKSYSKPKVPMIADFLGSIFNIFGKNDTYTYTHIYAHTYAHTYT